MRFINFGCGMNAIPGWENHDTDVDITRPLPYADNSVDACFAEHVVEHLTIQQAWDFFDECLRILRPGGHIRITVPSMSQIVALADAEYIQFEKDRGWADGTRKGAIKAIIFGHGHKSAWNMTLLRSFLGAVGFVELRDYEIGESGCVHMRRLEGHGRVIGESINRIESVCVEGVK